LHSESADLFYSQADKMVLVAMKAESFNTFFVKVPPVNLPFVTKNAGKDSCKKEPMQLLI